MKSTAFASFALTLSWAVISQAAPRPESRFVVIVGNNQSLTPGVAPLRFADDDAARWYEILAPTAREISLFTVLDAESQRVFREEARVAEAPTRARLLARLGDYNRKMQAARAEGSDPVLVFVFVGHGEVGTDGEGFVSLLDAPFSRGDLFREVIAPSQAAFNHIIVDACNSYLMVARRGGAAEPGPDASAAIRRYIADEDLGRYPNTGVLLSTTRAQVSHEWSEYRGGIFSHEVRSGLVGAADVNGDGRVEYGELRAFIAAANLRVDDPRARLEIFSAPPALDRDRPLFDLRASRISHFVLLPREAEGHYYLEDARGVRYADFNKAPEGQLIVGLVDSPYYYLRTDDAETELPLTRPGALRVPTSGWQRRAVAARGSLADSLREHLFEVPFGPAFYRGFVASAGDVPVADAPAFTPKSIDDDAEPRRELEAQLAALRIAPSDSFGQSLLRWARSRTAAADYIEANRTLHALQRRAYGTSP